MRIIIVLIAVAVLLWLLKRSLRGGGIQPPPPPPAGPTQQVDTPTPVLACAQCGVHLPRDEVLPGRGGVFCGDAHRRAYELAHPDS